MELILLGTGNAAVTEVYNTCFVLKDSDRYLLVDGGGGGRLLHQLKAAGIDWKNVRDIILTHKHLDHIMGIIWMLRMILQNMQRKKYEGEANIYGHAEVLSLLRDLAHMLLTEKECAFMDERLHFITVDHNETRNIIGYDFTFFDIGSTKAKQFGFTVSMEGGKKLTCCGDEPFNESELTYVQGSDWMLHEAFCLYSQADVFEPYKKNHSTVKDACILAEQLHVPNLVLYHTEDKNILHRKELYTKEGKQYYSGNLYIPEDLDRIQL